MKKKKSLITKKKKSPSYLGGNVASRTAVHLKNTPRRGSTVIESAVQARLFRGPLPPPEDLLAYEDITPGAAERILAMAERQQQHDHEMEILDYKYRKIGLIGGMILFPLSLAVGAFLSMTGSQFVAATLFAPLTVIAIMSFVGGYDKLKYIGRNIRKSNSQKHE